MSSVLSSLRSRLILLVLTVAIPLSALTVYNSIERRRLEAKNAERSALRIAQEASAYHEEIIKGAQQLLVGLAELQSVREHDAASCSRLFAKLLKDRHFYSNLATAKPNGDIFCSAAPLPGVVNVGDRPYFQQVLETRDFTLSDYLTGRITGKPNLILAYPALDDARVVKSVVLAALDLNWFRLLAARETLPPSAVMTVTDHNGTILSRYPDGEEWIGKAFPEASIFKAMQTARGDGMVETVGLEGVRSVYGFTRLRGSSSVTDVHVSVGIPTAVVYAEATRMLVRNLAVLGLVTLAALIGVWIVSQRSILRPIESLVNATNRLAGGDLGVRTGLPYNGGELGQLAESFDAMADALQTEEAERMRAQQALRTSEARYRSVAQSAKNAIIIADSKGDIVAWNKGSQETFGYAEEEVLGRPLTLLMPARYHEAHRQGLERFRSTGESHVIGSAKEYEGLRKDGSEFPIELSLSFWKTEEGIFFSGIAQDITERKQAEEMLRGSESRYRTLFEASPSGILLIDPETMLPIDFNPTAHRQLGYSRDEFAQLKISDYEVIEKPVETKAHAEKILRAGRDDFETKHRTKQGEIRNILVTVQVIELAGQRVFHSIFRDITNLKREQEKIAILAEIDKAITSTLEPKAVLTLLLEKIGALLPYSAAAVMLLNKATGDLEPEAVWNINEQTWKEHMTRIRSGGFLGKRILETRTPLAIANLHTDPRPLHPEFFRREGIVSYLGIPLIAKDKLLGILSIYSKEEHEFTQEEVEFLTTLAGQAAVAIHNAELYEETAKLASDLSRSNSVKDEFLSVMSHELRTPLNVVMGYTAMMKDGMLGEVNPKQDEALGKILGRANDQLAMINNILYATSIEATKIPVERQVVILADLLNDLESAYFASALSPDLTLIWDCPPDLPILETDRTKLRQILQNLIDNAIKFTEKGKVTVSARHDVETETVQLRVADTGIGIPADMITAIFEKFHQVDSSETRLYGGVGMGLYIVRRFTEMLGGKIEVESEVGKGSTFTVRVPLRWGS